MAAVHSSAKNTVFLGGYSGGIDSQAAALLMRQRHGDENVILLNSDAGGWEHFLTAEHVKTYSRTVHEVIPVEAKVSDLWKTEGFAETKGYDGEQKLTMELLCKIKGRAPSRTRQFCTNYLKLIPMKRWQEENLEGKHFVRFTGVRRDESLSSADTPLAGWDEYFDCEVLNPIADWKKEQCFETVQAAGEVINPLYTLGFNRVGCAPCINSNKDDILAWAQRFPDVIARVRELERIAGCTFFAPIVPGKVMNFIDEVIQWAKTDRGGRQSNIFRILNERPACESKYGLCE